MAEAVSDEREAVSTGVVRVSAAVCLAGCLVLVLHALALGFYIEATPQALRNAATGKAVGYPAALGALAAAVALAVPGRLLGRVGLVLAVLLGATALVVDIVR